MHNNRHRNPGSIQELISKHFDRISNSINDPTKEDVQLDAEFFWTVVYASYHVEQDPVFVQEWKDKEADEEKGPQTGEDYMMFRRRIRFREFEVYSRSLCRQGILAKNATPYGDGAFFENEDEYAVEA